MRTKINRSCVFLLCLILLLSLRISAAAFEGYAHDPMENPKAAADIVVDPNAVYGYAPNPDSVRLSAFVAYDWSDETFVAQMRQEREDYHASMLELYQIKADMESEGKSVEEIARAVSTRRNEIRKEAYKDDPEGLEKLKQSNLAAFGNENGGTPEYFYKKYGSWEVVIEKSFATNAGADAILGLYDKYYDTYFVNSAAQSEATESTQDETESETEPYPEEPTTPVGNLSKTSPQTGDRSFVLPVFFILAAAAVVTAILLRMKRTNERS